MSREDAERRITGVMAVNAPGGAELHLLRLLDGLEQRGWRVGLATPGRGPIEASARGRGWEWRALPLGGLGARRGARAVASWPRARSVAAEAGVVYLNGGVPARLMPAMAGSSALTVIHVHDMVERVPVHWRRAGLVLADSQAVADRLSGLEPVVVYGPVDPDPPAVNPPWPAASGPVIGFVGRLEPRKGVLDLVRAAPAIHRARPDARVVIVGDDPYGSDPGYAAAARGAADVEWYPWQAGAAGLMRHLDVLVLPSYREPFGTVLAEAMIVGTPVVATAVDGIPEVVRDGVTGRLVAPGDAQALAGAILAVLAEHATMSVAARAHGQRFATSGYVERVEGLLLERLTSHP